MRLQLTATAILPRKNLPESTLHTDTRTQTASCWAVLTDCECLVIQRPVSDWFLSASDRPLPGACLGLVGLPLPACFAWARGRGCWASPVAVPQLRHLFSSSQRECVISLVQRPSLLAAVPHAHALSASRSLLSPCQHICGAV